jgi:hypothetical protein
LAIQGAIGQDRTLKKSMTSVCTILRVQHFTTLQLQINMASADVPKAANNIELTKRLAQLLKRNGNKVCADCPEKRPTWGSIVKPSLEAQSGSETLVAFVCFQCAGIHRRLGTHVCFVRSVSLDDWNSNDVHMAEVSGNDVVNRIYESNLLRIQHHADSRNMKPLAGAHMATRERYIRSKYIDLIYYSKHAHCDYINQLQKQQQQQSPTKMLNVLSPIKSPMKKLGMFLQNEKVSLMKKVGVKSVCSSTYESSSDEKSFLSAPVMSSSRESTASSSNDEGRSDSHSLCTPSVTKQLRKGRRPDLNSSGIVNLHESAQSLAFDSLNLRRKRPVPSFSNGGGHQSNYSNSSTSPEFQGSQEQLPTGSGHSFLGKPAPVHEDPRRTAFHNSRNGFDVSPEELTNNSNHNPKPRPTLVSANSTRIKNSNSRMSMYAHGARGRSSSRKRESSLENDKLRRSSSRPTGEKADFVSEVTRSGSRGRGRSKGAKKDHDIKAGVSRKTGDRNKTKPRTRSSSQQRRTDPSSTLLLRRGQSRSRQSRSYDPIDRLHNSLSQLNQLYNDPLKRSNHSLKRESGVEYKVTLVPGENRNAPPRSRVTDLPGTSSRGEDLSGMILIFDESCKILTADVDIDDPDGPKERYRNTSRTRTWNTEQPKSNEKRRERKLRSPTREQQPRRQSVRRESSRSREHDGISISPVRTTGGQDKSSPCPSRRGRSFRSLSRRDGENLSLVHRNDRSQSRGRSSSRSLRKDDARQHSSSCRLSDEVDKDNLKNKSSLFSRSLEANKHIPSKKKLAHPPEEKKGSPRASIVKGDNLPCHNETKQRSPRSSRAQAYSLPRYNSERKKQSPRKSGEEDFQVINSKNTVKGSNDSWEKSSFTKPYKKGQQQVFLSNMVSEGSIKDKRRCSRTAMAARTAQRKCRKSDIFASLDREENENSKPSGPLLRNLPQRSKSGESFPTGMMTKNKLMIRSTAPPPRSKSMDTNEMALVKPPPELDLGLELGSGHNNDVLLKAWEARTGDISHQLDVLDKRTRVVDV